MCNSEQNNFAKYGVVVKGVVETLLSPGKDKYKRFYLKLSWNASGNSPLSDRKSSATPGRKYDVTQEVSVDKQTKQC